MMFSNYSSSTVVAVLLSSLTAAVQAANWNGRATPVTCSICRDANRPILNPNKSFTMNNGNTWTCNYLQETVQDVDEQSSYESERIMCRQAQLQAETGGCECGGAALPPMNSMFTDINPACNLCAGQASPVVPISNYNEVVQTNVVGSMNCKGLYDAMTDGIISAALCPAVQRAAGSTCCTSSGGSSSGLSSSQTTSQIASQFTPDNNISYNNGSPSVPAPAQAPVQAPGQPWIFPNDPLPAAANTGNARVIVPAPRPLAPAPAPTPLYSITARPEYDSTSSSARTTGRHSDASSSGRDRRSANIRGAAESPSF
mmetsp:Transcript_64260/g.71968  ORF Transcript_64260/g.71968 Transcript_64260/m.71968 type:complete len:314 (+) Transcript_64260:161-1102(+)